MSKKAKNKKEKIDVTAFNFNIWGINSAMEDYRFCWHLNKILKWELKRVNDVEFYNLKEKKEMQFNAYKYENDTDLYTIEILQNKRANCVLLPELKHIDYLFLFQGEEDYFNKDEITQFLGQIPAIQSIFEIDINKIKSKHNLLMRHFNDTKQQENKNSSDSWTGN
jgi:hypothetical protein